MSTSWHGHLIKLEFCEMKYRLMAFLLLAESKLKSWIVKYGRRDSVELLLQSYLVSWRNCCRYGSGRANALIWTFIFPRRSLRATGSSSSTTSSFRHSSKRRTSTSSLTAQVSLVDRTESSCTSGRVVIFFCYRLENVNNSSKKRFQAV